MDKKQKYYIVYWRNKDFVRTRYRPMKVGQIFAVDNGIDGTNRKGFNEKNKNFAIIEKAKLLFTGTHKEFVEWLEFKDA